MAPRKVTFNLDEGVFKDAKDMLGALGHKTMSSLVEAAVQEYIVTHALRLHNQWMVDRGLLRDESTVTEETVTDSPGSP